jgi:predicted MFS family arabinose efflux permease
MTSANKSKQLSYYILGIIVCSLAVLFYAYEFTVRTIPSAITHELMQDFHITAAGLGVLMALFYYGYALMQIPVGLMFDSINARKILLLAMAGCTLGTFLFGLSPNVYVADFALFLVGFSSAFAFVGCLVLASRIFPAKYYAMITGIVQLVGCLGAIIGQTPIAVLVQHHGWRHTMMFTTLVGVGILALMWLFLRGNLEHSNQTSFDGKAELKRLKEVSKNPQTWWTAIYSFTSWTPVLIFAGLWGVPFLMTLYHTDAAIAGTGTTAVWIGIAVGSPLVGWWSDRIKRRCLPLALCSIVGFASAI